MPVSVATTLDFLFANSWDVPAPPFLSWPPDAFGVAAWILSETGGYLEVLSKWSPDGLDRKAWIDRTKRAATKWRESSVAERPVSPPRIVLQLWGKVRALAAKSVDSSQPNAKLSRALIELVALADEASVGAGLPGNSDRFCTMAIFMLAEKLADSSQPSTLCKFIDPSKAIVLPKTRTPDNGITIRSLTHNLAFVRACGIQPRWCVTAGPKENSLHEHSLNLLVVPWPMNLSPSQFTAVDSVQNSNQEKHGYFTFRPKSYPPGAVREIVLLCQEAKRAVGRIDGVVFPEMALDHKSFLAILKALRKEEISLLVAGLFDAAEKNSLAENYACIAVVTRNGALILPQRKHHRWFLDDRQICSYGLASQLETTRKWWEHTVVKDRQLHFISLSGWMTLTVLICEDLARVDPAGDIIRAVGPNLVIALLQDGPQLSNRWPARAAHPLADDPGSSVLTLTGLGMSQLMRPPVGKSPSRAVAMWRDRQETVEIELPVGTDAIVLSMTNRYQMQWTADGRDDGKATGTVGLGGILPIRLPIASPRRNKKRSE